MLAFSGMVLHLHPDHPAWIDNIEILVFTEFQANSQAIQLVLSNGCGLPSSPECMSSRPVAALVVLAQNRLVVILSTAPIGRSGECSELRNERKML